MPKVLVLFDSADERAARFAELAAEGAKSVRFTEVDVRVVGEQTSDGSNRRRLESGDAVDQYDGVIVASSDRDTSAAIEQVLRKAGHSHGEFVDRVFAAVGRSAVATRLTELGGIVVGVRAGLGDADRAARNTGERVAKVVEWVRHSLSHEHAHGHHHTH